MPKSLKKSMGAQASGLPQNSTPVGVFSAPALIGERLKNENN
jgi:hypothetical protein